MGRRKNIPAPESPFAREGISTVPQWRAAIIESTLHHGLIAGHALQEQGWPVLHSSYPPQLDICGYTFFTFWGDMNKARVEMSRILHQSGGSLDLMAERHKDDQLWRLSVEERALLVSKRINSSFLVVCDSGKETHEWTNSIPLSDVRAFVIPKDIWEEFLQTNTGDIDTSRVRVVDSIVEKEIARYESLAVPDYEEALFDLMTERVRNQFKGVNRKLVYTNPDIWVHAVRLPIEEDLSRLQQDGLSR